MDSLQQVPKERILRFAAWKAYLWQEQQRRLGALQLRWARARVLVDVGYACSGVSAGWCPSCGDCTCPRDEDGGWVEEIVENGDAGQSVTVITLNGPGYGNRIERVEDPDCPLHARDSPHAEGEVD